MGVQTMRRSQKDADVCTDAQRASKVGAQAAKSPDSSFTPLSPSSGSARSWAMSFSLPSLGVSLAVRLRFHSLTAISDEAISGVGNELVQVAAGPRRAA